VDYKIMMSFGEFYEALLRFVNFKLYKDAGMEYPPTALNDLNLTSNTVFSLIQPYIHQAQTQFKQKSAESNPEHPETANAALEQFKQFRFFMNREVPHYALELVLLSAGCQLGFDGRNSPFDESAEGITHHIVDRPVPSDLFRLNREYVQPQWVFDCLNHSVLLPASHYAPGKVLHLL
jgi:pescadillo protein